MSFESQAEVNQEITAPYSHTTVMPSRPQLRPTVVSADGLRDLADAASKVPPPQAISPATPSERLINSFTDVVKQTNEYALKEIADLTERLDSLRLRIESEGITTIGHFTNFIEAAKNIREQVLDATKAVTDLESTLNK